MGYSQSAPSANPQALAQAAPIEQFGKYQILERIARGGMAEIYKARMEGIGGFNRLFAIKRILPGLSQNKEYIDLLVDEAKIAGLLSHANIVQILDLGQYGGQYYVAMEYVHGRDLGTVVTRCGERGITLPVPHAVFILIEVLKGLEYAHNRQIMRGNRAVPLNIVHRDVSPSNVLVSFQGEVKLTDFGIAKANVKAMETLSGVIKGKFDYMSPEQASGGDLDQRTDIFAAGVLLYEMLCGAHPFRKNGEIRTIEAIRKGEYEPPSFVNPDVPYGLELIIDQALARDPNERYATATDFKDALTGFFHGAGFIFSHSTLAAFLKGLFPEANLRKKRPGTVVPLREQETRPLAPSDLPDEDERPTQVDDAPPQLMNLHDRAMAASPAAELPAALSPQHTQPMKVPPNKRPPTGVIPIMGQTAQPAQAIHPPAPAPVQEPDRPRVELSPRASAAFGQDPGVGLMQPIHQSRHRPPAPVSVEADDQEAQDRADEWNEEIETVIRQDGLALQEMILHEEEEELELDEPTRTHPDVAKTMNLPTPLPSEPPTEVRRAGEALKRARTRGRLFAVLVGLTTFMMGLVVGVAAGFAIGTFQPAPAPVLPAASPPIIQVFAPQGSKVFVDDEDMGTVDGSPLELTLDADTPARLRVEVEGQPPFEQSYALKANDLRVLRLQLEDLAPPE